MTPGSYTELFFLDEAVALAAGHRPCAECRHDDYVRFRQAWAAGERGRIPTANDMDRTLAADRLAAPRIRRTYREQPSALPDGVYVALDGAAWLLWRGAAHRWSAAGYVERRRRPRAEVTVLTPRRTVAVITAGYRPHVHPTAGAPP